MKKILYIWKGPYPWDVRTEKVCRSMSDAGYEVYMLARWNGEVKKEEIIDDINVVRVGYGLKSIFSEPVSINPIWRKAIEKSIIDKRPNIVIPREILLGEAAAQKSRKYNIPIIMDMAENYPAAMKLWKKYKTDIVRKTLVHSLDIPERIEKASVKQMDGIITVCDEQILRLEHEYNFQPNKCIVVHNTPSIHSFSEYIQKDYFKYKTLTFGHHGFTSDEKKIDNLILGFDKAANNYRNIKLKIAGDGESYKDLVQLRDKCKHKDRIVLSGGYQYIDLISILNEIDIGVIPYEVNDFNNYTIHNKIFDFFMSGKPVIVTPAIPLMRIVEETGAGLVTDKSHYLDIALTIEKILNMDINEFSIKSRNAAVEKYNWELDSKKLIKFIESYI